MNSRKDIILVILGATDKRAPAGFAPIAIGLTLTIIHLVSIPVTNTSVNPARSTGPALVDTVAGQVALLFGTLDALEDRLGRQRYLCGDLQTEAGILPFLTGTAYDFSNVIPEDSILFIVLRGIFGFHNSMTWLQFVVWAAFIAITMVTFVRKSMHRKITPVETTEIRIIRSVN